MDKKDKPDNIEPTLPAEATEKAEATEPAEPMDRIDPAEPIDRIEPVEPMERMDPLEPMDRIEPVEPASGGSRLVCMIAFSQHGPAGRRTRPAAGLEERDENHPSRALHRRESRVGLVRADRAGTDGRLVVYQFNWGYYLESLRLLCTTGTGKPFQPTS
jgi:hypothetical protein